MALNIRQKGLVKIFLKTGEVKVGNETKKPNNKSEACTLIKCSMHDFNMYEKKLNLATQAANRKQVSKTS